MQEQMAELLINKPFWLNKRKDFSAEAEVMTVLRSLGIHTVCEEALCPNMSECFSKKLATFLILGNVCTRSCTFCGVKKGKPLAVDCGEPLRVAKAAERLSLNYAVVTSVTRDDLDDKGVEQFVRTIQCIRVLRPQALVETLIPDFCADRRLLKILLNQRPSLVCHNIETVKRLYPLVRSGSCYQRSLDVLRLIKEMDDSIKTKSAILLGLGETEEEVVNTFIDLRKAGCDFLTVSQYLMPGKNNFPIKEYVGLDRFKNYKKMAEKLGFEFVISQPYARSSYNAFMYLGKNRRPS